MDLNKNNENKYFFSLIQGLNFEPSDLPIFKEGNNDWVFYGIDNNYPKKLIDYYSRSPIHNSIINTKVNLIIGDGPYQTNENEISERTENFINHPNKNENLENIMRKLSKDFELFGLSYIQIIYTKDRTSIAEIYQVDASKIRWGKLDEKGNLTHFWYSRDWSNYRKESHKPILIPIYNPELRNSQPIQLLMVKNKYIPGVDYYTYPNYISAIDDIEIDIEISNYHLNNIKNGFSPTIFFGFVGDTPTEEERLKIVEQLQQYKGANGRKEIVSFMPQDRQPYVKILESSQADKMFLDLQETTLRKILIAHQVVNENLVGISTPGKLGNSAEILSNFELFFNQVIKNDQKYILDAINMIALFNGLNQIDIKRNKPLNHTLSENILTSILTKKELRVLIGETPEPEQEMIDEQIIQIEENENILSKLKLSKEFHLAKDLYSLPDGNDDDLFIWVLGSEEEESCPICKGFKGQVRSLKSWKKRAIPKTPFAEYGGTPPDGNPGPYGTFCEDDCKCRLIKINQR